jgi:hypothetical protein
MGRLDVSGIKLTATSGTPNGVVVNAGTVNRLVIDKCQMSAPGGVLLRVNNGATVTQAILAKNTQEGGMNLVTSVTGASLPSVSIMGLASSGSPYPLGVYQTTTSLSVSGANCTGMTAWIWVTAAGLVTITGANGLSGDNNTFLGAVNFALNSSVLNQDPDLLTAGEETIRRLHAQTTPQLSTGNMVLTYFTARRSETINNVAVVVGGTAAAGTTLARYGIYSVAANGDLTLVASTANDTTLWNSTFAGPSRALSSSWSKVAGQRYALAALFVGTTGPKLSGAAPANGTEMGRTPRLNGSIASQADLPSTVTAGTVSNSQGISVYAALTP